MNFISFEMNETERYVVLIKSRGCLYIPNGPVYKCALPQTHLIFKLSETRSKTPSPPFLPV